MKNPRILTILTYALAVLSIGFVDARVEDRDGHDARTARWRTVSKPVAQLLMTDFVGRIPLRVRIQRNQRVDTL